MEKSALIIFAKLPREGEVKTRLGTSLGMARATELYRQFAEHAFRLGDELRRDGMQVYLFFAPGAAMEQVVQWVARPFIFVEQSGPSLGERMKSAFARTFRDGAEKSAIIGTDVPELDVATIRSAFEDLESSEIVLGPSNDGGYYLLGMRAPGRDVFEGIEWGSNTVLSRTLEHIHAQGISYKLLPVFSDVDTLEDFQQFEARRRFSRKN